MVRRSLLAAAAVAALALPAAAGAHPERPVEFPDGSGDWAGFRSDFPDHRARGPSQVVCKPDSRERIMRYSNRRLRRKLLRVLRRCEFEHIQEAVNAASNGDRVLILPGVYREEPSREVPNPDPRCEDMYVQADGKSGMTPTYEYELNCPNSRNLVAILGDTDGDGRCDAKCGLQIEGLGRRARDVIVEGDVRKTNVFKADRADGIYFRNLTAQYSDYNNFYVLETDGFRFDHIVSRWSNEYGFLSFVSDHGIYEDLEAYGAGDAGVYPGSGPITNGERFGIIIRRVNSYGSLQGNSGTAASGTLYEDNRFHHNGVGLVVDSFSTGHPGSPQDYVTWRGNEIYSNNVDYFTAERDEYCKRPYAERDPKVVCPAILVPIGTGLLIAGGNDNLVEGNRIWDNWRHGAMLFFVEAAFRGEDDPTKMFDTSHRNVFRDNVMGVARDGDRSPNGTDFWWDEAGSGNCWEGNTRHGGEPASGDPSPLPDCPGSEVGLPVQPLKHALLVPCATWDPQTNTDPPGCDWLRVPPKPE